MFDGRFPTVLLFGAPGVGKGTQGTILGQMLKNTINVLAIIHLICLDEAQMIDRIKRRAIRDNRADDANEDIIRTRFNVYRAESEPVINCYPKELIKCVDAMKSPPEVLVEVLQHLIPIRNTWLADLPESPL